MFRRCPRAILLLVLALGFGAAISSDPARALLFSGTASLEQYVLGTSSGDCLGTGAASDCLGVQ